MQTDNKIVTLGHGCGGKLTHDLILSLIAPKHADLSLDDAASINIDGVDLAFTSDSFVINPYFFPGGDIGNLSVFGTVNDLAMQAATPLYMSTSLIIEEGFPMEHLDIILQSMADAAKSVNVKVITGDTKVVERGACDNIFINTAAIGKVAESKLCHSRIDAGDKIIITGNIGEHGAAVMASRYGFKAGNGLLSDSRELYSMIEKVIHNHGEAIKWMRDPTRGGVAATLNELARDSGLTIDLEQRDIPASSMAETVFDVLGIDILTAACEGVAVIVADALHAADVLKTISGCRQGKEAKICGTVLPKKEAVGLVLLRTSLGTKRIVNMPSGEQLPRIC